VPSVRPGDPSLTPTGEMMIVLVNRFDYYFIAFAL
jgi:hypothetical protein